LTVILDTDFLSAFLKIDQLPLVKDFYEAEVLLVPEAVHRELSSTRLAERLAELPWIRVEAPLTPGSLLPPEDAWRLGEGEKEAMALAFQYPGSLLLTNDNQARIVASRRGLSAIDIPSFLLSCKSAGFLDGQSLDHLISSLRDKDHYSFRREILERLRA
jgi:predicted nucleic acid-binding protein